MMAVEGCHFSICVGEWDGVTVIGLTGELDVSNVGVLHEVLRELDLGKGPDVRVDLTNLQYLDSTGIGALIMACKLVRGSGGTFSGTCRTEQSIRRILALVGAVEYLQFEEIEPADISRRLPTTSGAAPHGDARATLDLLSSSS